MTTNRKTLASKVLSRNARRFAVLGAILGASTLLSGCMTYMKQSVGAPLQSCLSDREDIVAEADWDNALTLNAKFLNGEFHPMVLYVESGRPYILRVRNLDRENHSLWAPDFLKQGVALDTIQMDDKTPANACVNGVRVQARSTVTFRFVPVWEGRYEVANSLLPMFPPSQLTDGVFHIIEPRIGGAVN